MEALWFALAAVMVAVYVVMDGFDFGAGALHLLVAQGRSRAAAGARRHRPVLGRQRGLAAGRRAACCSWPFRRCSPRASPASTWRSSWCSGCSSCAASPSSSAPTSRTGCGARFWDGVFAFASLLAPVLFGAALGNVLRGVPLGADGWFALPLFDSFSPRGALGILDWYTVLAGVIGAGRDRAPRRALPGLEDRRRRCASAACASPARAVPVAGRPVWVLATAATWLGRPGAAACGARARPLALVSTLLLVAGLVTSCVARRRGRDLLAFLGSVGVPARRPGGDRGRGLPDLVPVDARPRLLADRANTAASDHALRVGLYWWPVGFVLALVYFAVLFRLHRGKAQAAAEGEGY